jgi:hypothetical protein
MRKVKKPVEKVEDAPKEKPAVVGSIVSATITEYDTRASTTGKERFVEYCIEVTEGACRRCVWHRYSNFRVLHHRLVDRFGKDVVPEITGKKIFSKTASTLNKRQEKLTTFIEGILAADELRSSEEFKTFLSLASAKANTGEGAAGAAAGAATGAAAGAAGAAGGGAAGVVQQEGGREGEAGGGEGRPSADLSSDDEGTASTSYYS